MDNKEVGISYGCLSDSIEKQLDKQNLKYNKGDAEFFTTCKDAVNDLRMADLLTDSMTDKVTLKLHKRIISHVAKQNKLKINKVTHT